MSNRPDNPDSEGHDGLASVAETIARWRDDYLARLRQVQELRFELREYQTGQEREIKAFLKSLLEAMDSFDKTAKNFEQALLPEDKKAARVLKSFTLLRRQFAAALKQFEVAPMETGGEFIPGLHKALGIEASAEVPEGCIIRVERRGYYWRNNILRPAEVIVSSPREEMEEKSEDEGEAPEK